jgi:Putative beta-lactamase-inhibitor-like, PepSY-like
MRRLVSWLGAVMSMLLLPVAAICAEEEIPLDKVPPPVMEAVKARFKDAEMTGAAKEMDQGKVVYEVTLRLKGQHIDVILAPEGEIVLIEKAIARNDLPTAVAKALEDKYPKATYKVVEEVVKVEKKEEKLEYYEARLVTAEKKRLEVKVTPGGKIVKGEDAGSE